MKLEIESVSNGYVITVPKDEYTEVERKYVIEEKDGKYGWVIVDFKTGSESADKNSQYQEQRVRT